MVVASTKEPLYASSMEDPKHSEWGKVVEPIVIPKGDDGLPMYNHIYADHVCAPLEPPPGGFIDKLWGRDLVRKAEAKAKAAQLTEAAAAHRAEKTKDQKKEGATEAAAGKEDATGTSASGSNGGAGTGKAAQQPAAPETSDMDTT
eukprot:10135953-Karenia_brevis.AAC.1